MLYTNSKFVDSVKVQNVCNEAVSKSDQQYASKRREEIDVLPEFAKLFLESTFYSSKFACHSIAQEVVGNLVNY